MSNVEIIEPKKKGGSKSEFNQEVFDAICDRMAEGKSLRQVCEQDGMPHRSTFLRWVKERELQEPYTQARVARYDWIADEAIRIADDASGDYFVEDRDGKSIVVPDHARVQRAKLQVDTRKWILSKLDPWRYGDKAGEKPEGESGGNTVILRWTPSVRVVVYPMLRDDGTIITTGTPEYEAAIEKAAQEARDRGEKEVSLGIDLKREEQAKPPAQITYQPEPLPGGLSEGDWAIMGDVLRLIKQTIPTDDTSPPDTIFRVMKEALLLHFREVDIDASANAA